MILYLSAFLFILAGILIVIATRYEEIGSGISAIGVMLALIANLSLPVRIHTNDNYKQFESYYKNGNITEKVQSNVSGYIETNIELIPKVNF